MFVPTYTSRYTYYGSINANINQVTPGFPSICRELDCQIIHIHFVNAGAKEVDEQDDMFVLVAPQNAVGNCIIDVSNTLDIFNSI